jgi:two-component system, cell cycle response regulator DivK
VRGTPWPGPFVSERRSSPDRRQTPRGGRRDADHCGRPVVLVVDDHADSRELMAAVLQEIGVAMAEAATGREALRRAAALPIPQLILIDLSLPDCHGTEVVRVLKQDDSTFGIPIVALSASVMAADKEAAAAAGCVAFIEKPVLPDEVVRVVRRVLSGAAAG